MKISAQLVYTVRDSYYVWLPLSLLGAEVSEITTETA